MSGLVEQLQKDVAALDAELGEIDLLITQARSEAGRHEARRAQGAEKAARAASGGADAAEIVTLHDQLVTLTKRAALMESQVDVLEGKRRALGRFRDAVARYAEAAISDSASGVSDDPGEPDATEDSITEEGMPPAFARLLLNAQEDLRREIARAMHDGPAQSLTNIVLQAQIVERLVARDPASAHGEVKELVGMVQQTLDATKSFIFDVRPMVLDDLGLLPTLRRAARERGARSGVQVELDSLGQDRRLSMELESGLFRILDEALAAYLSMGPDRVALRLDWGDALEASVSAARDVATPPAPAPAPEPAPQSRGRGRKGKEEELPPALAAMIEDRAADERVAAEAARRDAILVLPEPTWREIQGRVATLGITAELRGDGAELWVSAPLPGASGAR
jgi:two-component system sensor histidine kinase DegS